MSGQINAHPESLLAQVSGDQIGRADEPVSIRLFIPRPEWPEADRLSTIAELATIARQRPELSPIRAFDLVERLYFIATSSPAFLELNREAILKGHQ